MSKREEDKFQFIREDSIRPNYHDKYFQQYKNLYKEYAICDLTMYKSGK